MRLKALIYSKKRTENKGTCGSCGTVSLYDLTQETDYQTQNFNKDAVFLLILLKKKSAKSIYQMLITTVDAL